MLCAMASERRTTGAGDQPSGQVPVALLHAALEMVADGVVLVDSAGVMIFVNRTVGDLLGYNPRDLVGQSLEVLVPDHIRGDHRAARAEHELHQSPRKMGQADLDIEARHADGRSIPVDVELSSVPGTSVIVASVRDMTHERAAAAERAIQRLEWAAAFRRSEQLAAYYDLMMQQLFALGSHLEAEATRAGEVNGDRFLQAASVIDQLIDVTRSQAFGPTELSL